MSRAIIEGYTDFGGWNSWIDWINEKKIEFYEAISP